MTVGLPAHFKRAILIFQTIPAPLGKIPGFPKAETTHRFRYMKFLTTLVRDEDGVWIAECPSIPGCVSQGQTREEATTNIREAIAICLEVRADRGKPLTIETQQVEVAV